MDPDSLVNGNNKTNEYYNILHLNIQGIKLNIDKLLVFIQTYDLALCNIIILAECHRLETFLEFNIPVFSIYYDEGDLST